MIHLGACGALAIQIAAAGHRMLAPSKCNGGAGHVVLS